ncbi:HtaA domain-containing protein, partial [Brevibacterium luteolum]|nr:HtaA domain-containing protein [Brevibacterium luteolum]
DAVFTWGVNKESGSGAYLPGSCNFLSAGESGDAGSSRVWKEEDGLLKAKEGNVTVLKPGADGKPEPITWENKCLTAKGEKVDVRGKVSDNYVQISGGTGTVDPVTDTGTISWKGSFTIVYYSGHTYWTISDPKLEVTNGHGRITGTFTGYGTSMEDMTKWTKLDPVTGTVADFKNAKVDLSESGFAVTPDFAGVQSGHEDQKTGQGSGSFPKSWVDFNVKTGQAQYWFTSGGAADARKPATEIRVSFTGTAPDNPPPDDDPTDPPAEDPEPSPPPSRKPEDTSGTGEATMFWPVNAETSAGGFAPGTCNFMSAGVSPDSGGTKVWDAPGRFYKPSDGNVRIEKPDRSGTFHTATWENKCDDRNGKRVVANDKNSQHESRVVIAKGAADAGDGGITASWKGGFTIVFYSGMTYWSISDPQLKVAADGSGELIGTASGFAADMDDLSKWEPITPETITMATFSGVDVAKAIADGGFTVTPDFAGVRAPVDNQDRSSPGWGSFPASWVKFNQKTGQHSYWYTSGGIADPRKPAAPLTIALTADYQPPAADYAGASADGAGGTADPGGSAGPGGGSAGGPAGGAAPAGKAAPPAQTEDVTAFAPSAAEARAGRGVTGLSWQDWAFGGGTVAAALAGTSGIGWLLRRRIGLDPGTWR